MFESQATRSQALVARRPWFREPYVWMLIGIPGSAVIVGLFMLQLSISSWDGLVDDDYYKQGLAINQVKARDRAATEQGLRAQLDIDALTGALSIALQSANGAALPEQLRVEFHHATRSGMDRTLLVPRMVDGSYQAPMPRLGAGRWYVEISARDWRLTETVFAD